MRFTGDKEIIERIKKGLVSIGLGTVITITGVQTLPSRAENIIDDTQSGITTVDGISELEEKLETAKQEYYDLKEKADECNNVLQKNTRSEGDVLEDSALMIDVSSGVTEEEFESYLRDGINGENVEAVYLKLGNSRYGLDAFYEDENGDVQFAERTFVLDEEGNEVLTFKPYLDLCNKYGKDVGMYYYSTCINDKEAIKEAERIKELYTKGGCDINCSLPFAVDVEVSDDNDRQSTVSPEELSKSKATLVKELKNNGVIGEDYFLYSNLSTSCNNYDTKLIDSIVENDLKDGAPNRLSWLADPAQLYERESYSKIRDLPVSMVQSDLDVVVDGKIKYDVDRISNEVLDALRQKPLIKDEIDKKIKEIYTLSQNVQIEKENQVINSSRYVNLDSNQSKTIEEVEKNDILKNKENDKSVIVVSDVSEYVKACRANDIKEISNYLKRRISFKENSVSMVKAEILGDDTNDER